MPMKWPGPGANVPGSVLLHAQVRCCPNVPERAGVLASYPESLRRPHTRRTRSPGLKRRVKRAVRSAKRHIAVLAGR